MWTLHIQNSSGIRRIILKIHFINIFIFIVSRLLLFLLFYLGFLTLISFINRLFILSRIQINILSIIPIVIFPIFFIDFPRLKNLIRDIENRITELQGRLFLLFYPFKTEKDDVKFYKMAEKDVNKILSKYKLRNFVNFKPIIPVILLLPLLFVYKNNKDLNVVNPYIEILYKKDYVKKDEKFLIIANTNLKKLFLIDGRKKSKFYKIHKGFGILYSVQNSCSLKIMSGRFKKNIFINVIDDFKIVSVVTKVKYPARINTEYTDSVLMGSINFIEGSVLTVDGKMNREIKEIFANTKHHFENDKFHIEFKSNKDTLIKFYFKDEYGIKSDVFNVQVNIIKDKPPFIRIISPTLEVRITDIPMFPLSFEVEDDIGISSYSIQIDNEEIINKRVSSSYVRDSTIITLRNMLPNDTLTLYIKAKDVGGKIGISNPIIIYMPPLEELFKDISKTTDFIDEEAEELQKSQEEIKEKIERMIAKGNLTEKDTKELKKVLEQQKSLIENLENLINFAKNLNSPEIMKEMERIKELLDDIKIDLLKTMTENPLKDITELMEMKIEQEKLLNMLELTRKSLEMIKKISEINRAVAELESIKDKQQEVLDSFPETNSAEKEGEIKKDAESFIDKNIESNITELKETAQVMKDMNITEDMNTLKELMKNNKMDKMLSNKIMADLNNLINMLKKKREDLTGGEEIRKKIVLLATDIYFIIDKINDFQRIDDKNKKIRSYIGIKEGLTRDIDLSQKLFILTLSFSPKVFENLIEARSSIDDYLENISKNIVSDVLLNNAIAKMGEAIILLFSSPTQSASSMLQQLMQLYQQQLSINSQMSMILPMPSPQRGDELSELAKKQREIAKKIGELGEAFKPLKDEMEKIADMLEKNYVDEEVLKRQEKIIEQFLEAERSIRKKEISRKRKSEPGKDYPPVVVELLENMGEKNLLLKKLLMKRLREEKIPEKYRKDVEEYFWEILK